MQTNAVRLSVQCFQRGPVTMDQAGDNVSVFDISTRVAHSTDQYSVAVLNIGADHTVATDL